MNDTVLPVDDGSTQIIAKFTVIEQNAYATAGAVATEVLSSIRTVISFGGEHKAVARWAVMHGIIIVVYV